MKNKLFTILIIIIITAVNSFSQQKEIPLTTGGFIPAWLVAGPFDQPLTGFGTPSDSDVIGEKKVEPFPGKEEKDTLLKSGIAKWIPQSTSLDGFLNFNNSLRWNEPGNTPEKIWYAITGYAAAYLESEIAQNAVIKFGSNSFGKIFVNGEEVYSIQNSRNARIDQDSINIKLKKGKNLILVKVGNSHNNHALAFFEVIKWEWGFYFKLVDENNKPLQNVKLNLPETVQEPEINIVSTFFFKNSGDGLQQRFDVEITSPYEKTFTGQLNIKYGNQNITKQIESVPYGYSRHEIYIPEIKSDIKAVVKLSLNNEDTEKEITLFKQPHYKMHVMMLAHTDIGYTHTQPVVKEIHCNTLDDVVQMCNEFPDFKWTIETMWQLEQYEQSRTPEQFQKLISLIKEGRVAVSPLYSNPFTGWVGEEEMIRSLSLAKRYKQEFGLEYNAAVYNDVPGQAWVIPGILTHAGVKFVAEGLNEFFNNYTFQKSLPKAFIWEGSDGSRVVTYLNSAYNEARSYALESRGNFAVQQKLWERLNNLKAKGYDYDMVLLDAAFGDNTIVPKDQYLGMLEWNKEYEYPKFISSNVSEFAKEFVDTYKDSLPVLKGDWTSNWDIYYQGEPRRMKDHRWVQHNLLSAEKLAVLTSLVDKKQMPLSGYIDGAYQSILNFSGHGSGLEYGYGSPADNLLTMEFRENYIHEAYIKTEEVLQRTMFRFGKPEESFEGEGVIIFNTLSWNRDVPVEVQFTAETQQEYDVIDLTTKEKIPSYRDHYKLFFIAKDLPSMGYKKYRLTASTTNEKKSGGKDLIISSNSIENQFYKIKFNQSPGIGSGKRLESIIDKKSGKELIDKDSEIGFNQPLIERFQKNENYKQLDFPNEKIVIKDESPVRIVLSVIRENELFEQTDYTLWNNVDRIDIAHKVNLEKLKPTEFLEDYGIAFPFALTNQKESVEIIGGYLNPAKDKLPGSGAEGYSIRRAVKLSDEDQIISWATVDSRVIRLRESGKDKKKVIIANVLNNFPLAWNRYEENKGKIDLTFSFTSHAAGKDSSFTSRFGWELNTPAVVRRSWYRTEPTKQSYFNINNKNIALLTLKAGDNENSFSLRLINMSGTDTAEGTITSDFFRDAKAYYSTFLDENLEPAEINGNSLKVKLKPNEITTINIQTN